MVFCPPNAFNWLRLQLQHLLATSSQTLARDYYNEEEMAAKFKKGRRNKGNKTRRNTDSDDVKKEDRALVADYGKLPNHHFLSSLGRPSHYLTKYGEDNW